ncbi:RDD family protein [Pseudomonas sp.]|uniref:RDD family protein n=1 Tax=Pseudomonas sp. TaxID=306 RepID=UPI003D127015
MCRIRVIDGNGRPPVLLQVILRNLCRLIETNPFLLGPLPAAVVFIFSPRSQRMGDMLGRTYVIECKELAVIREQIERAQQGAPMSRLESGLGT